MKANFLLYYYRLQSNYWFIPTIMALAAIVLSFVTVSVDSHVGVGWSRNISWIYSNGPDGARAVLSAIAGSMITVAGVTFSMTIVTVSFASSNIGPRLIGNFMRDRGNQITLGTFIATFVYCLMILRTVRSADEKIQVTGVDQVANLQAFVPHVSVLCGLLMALASVAVLIYFIHHIPETINISKIIAGLGRQLEDGIEDQFPDKLGESVTVGKTESLARLDLPDGFLDDGLSVTANTYGYIQTLDYSRLMELAVKHDLILRLEYRPGDFATRKKVLLLAWPATRMTDEIADSLRDSFAWGKQRTPIENLRFVADEMVEIIARALSPGINDPFTAISCIDWLEIALGEMATRKTTDTFRYDEKKKLRIISHPLTFEQFASSIFDQTRPYISADRNTALYMMRMIAEVAIDLESDENRNILLKHAKALAVAGAEVLPLEIDREALEHRYQLVMRLMDDLPLRNQLRDNQGWLGGKA